VEAVIPDNFPVNFPEMEGRWKTTVTFALEMPIATMYTVPQPQRVSRPANYHFAYNPDGSVDIATIRVDKALLGGETYTVEAAVTDASISQLREAGTEYPEWVVERYLQIPSSITPRTLMLAQDITSGLDNPYDIAEAITQYLRDNIEYTDTLPERPPEQDPIDWMLFDLRQGFCNYYASAEVIMLRSLGIPARLAVGYAQGERTLGIEEILDIPEDQIGREIELGLQTAEYYEVKQQDAHAWPEVYFPGIGWVEFEPTGNQLPIVRSERSELTTAEESSEELAGLEDPREDQPQDEQGEDSQGEDEITGEDDRTAFTIGMISLVAGLILIAVAFTWRKFRKRGGQSLPMLVQRSFYRFNLKPPDFLQRWAQRASLPAMGNAYMEINRALARLGATPDPNLTPAERAMALAALLPMLEEPIHTLLVEYHAAAYSPHAANDGVALQSGRTIRNTSYLAMLQRWLARWQEPASRRAATLLSPQQ
jgi:transglutaminase-like putative cysteine protease